MFEGTIAFTLYCENCNALLSVTPLPDGSGTKFIVKPCPKCMKSEYDEGHDDGYSAGYSEGFDDGESEENELETHGI